MSVPSASPQSAGVRAEGEPESSFVLGLLTMALGGPTLAVGVAKLLLPAALWWGLGLTALGCGVTSVAALSTLRSVHALPAAADDCARYGRYMIGVTYLLLVLGLCMAAGAATLALDGALNLSIASPPGRVPNELDHRTLFLLLALSTLSALFGASFYVVNSLRSKRPHRQERGASTVHTGGEPFDVHAFWSGAFFRMGESLLFTLTFFTLIWSSERPDAIVWLPALALFVGMFVKAGEVVVFRLGMRVLSAADALLPGPPARPNAPSRSNEPPRTR